jgi:hypothetical protein
MVLSAAMHVLAPNCSSMQLGTSRHKKALYLFFIACSHAAHLAQLSDILLSYLSELRSNVFFQGIDPVLIWYGAHNPSTAPSVVLPSSLRYAAHLTN